MADKVSADRDLPIRTEVLHDSGHIRVSRLFFADRTVIRKEPLGADAPRRARHESAMLERLRGVPGVAQLVDAPRYPGSLVLADVGGVSLAGLVRPLAVADLIGLALGLARAVAGMHHRGVMHRDITPANIVLSGDGTACLVDFALATSMAEIRPEFTPHTEIVGTLAYLAPEQTGRTGRSADQRADLYALGATLYELATGAPPFGSDDPLRLTHEHLTRVPVPPAVVNPAVPGALSAIIMRLLAKEPDHRYQSAEGLLYDLERVRDDPAAGEFRVGAHDFPLRLLPPSRLVGREGEVATLVAAFDEALAGRCAGVLVAGAPGVGKTALTNELRPVVTGADGWFVAGKFDQYRRDLEFDAIYQALRALGRLLLAEPDEELAQVRERIVAAVGANAGLLAAVLPEFAALLAVAPEAGDPLTAQVRAQRAAVAVLRAVASRKRPMVVVVDDLQWAGRTPLGVVDLVLGEEPIEGLLLVGAYREVDPAHPLAGPLARWREQAAVKHLRLANLPTPSLATLVTEMLHVRPEAAAGLVEVIGAHTGGNPYETVELLNALRRDGLLAATETGWRWDAAAVRTYLGSSEVTGLSAGRFEAMPLTSRQIVEAMAGLGGRVELSLLQPATGEPASVVEQALEPALEEGLLVVEPGAHQAVRFRHDRIRETILNRLDPPRRRALQLAMARRLAAVPALFAVAAGQYLPVVDAVTDPTERPQVVGLLRRAAEQAALIGDHALVDNLLAAALRLIDPAETTTLIEVHTARHAALYSLGRLEEADEEYRTIEGLSSTTVERAGATRVQVRSLTHRTRFAEAITLGLASLRECGIAVPAAERLSAELDYRFEHLYRWLDRTDAADELVRPGIADPTLLAASHVLNAVLPAAFFAADYATFGFLSLEALRIWIQHGPTRTLLGPASVAAFHAVAIRGDYAAGYRALQRLLAVGEARGYEPDTSQARYMFTVSCIWFEPIENGVQAARQAREGLIAGRDLTNAGYAYSTATQYMQDCGPTLDEYVAEVEAGLSFTQRTGNETMHDCIDSYRWLAKVLRGESSSATGEAGLLDRYADNPMALLYVHLNHAVAAAIFGDPVALVRHTAAAMPLLGVVPGVYVTAVARLLRGLALAGELTTVADAAERAELLAELDEVMRWLAARAADAPDNFLHLLRLLEAERAWAGGDFRAAALAFDAARREVALRHRPWHQALITERAARFHLTHGLEHTGYELLARARQDYLTWGASAKVAHLDWAYPTLRPHPDGQSTPPGQPPTDGPHRRGTVSTGMIDLIGIVSASQALSSQTSIDRLHTRVVRVLSAMTGATGVHLLVWSQDRNEWLLPTSDGGITSISGAGHEHTVPMSVLRYVQRMHEPLVVADATGDDRFARDPYFIDTVCCSLLALPILNRGALQAVLVLENRLIRGAFTAERLDAVKLIAGQLAVSLDNAQLYAELARSRARIVAAADQARRRIERDLHDGAQQRLVSLALQLRAAQAEVPPELDSLDAQLDRAVTEATDALDELRDLARGIHPGILAKGGLGPALRALARRSPIPVDLHMQAPRRLPEHIEISAYYVVAEALTNAAKHARASTATVTVEADPAEQLLRLSVRDDGVGGADLARGTGLVGLKDRVEALGGRIILDSPVGAGTTLSVEFPNTSQPAPAASLPPG